MTDPSTTSPIVAQREDTRTLGPMTGGERAVLDHWLDLYRDTALLKIAGLDAEQLTRRAVPPSSLSLIGVVRHLTEVEAYWLRVVLLDEQDVPDHYCTPVSQDSDFDDVDPATASADVAAYQAELVSTRQRRDLDRPCRTRPRAARRQAGQSAVDPHPPHRGVRPPPWPHGPSSRGDRRPYRLLTTSRATGCAGRHSAPSTWVRVRTEVGRSAGAGAPAVVWSGRTTAQWGRSRSCGSLRGSPVRALSGHEVPVQ